MGKTIMKYEERSRTKPYQAFELAEIYLRTLTYGTNLKELLVYRYLQNSDYIYSPNNDTLQPVYPKYLQY
jgi:hypothetical protein